MTRIGSTPGNTVDILYQGFGMRLAGAPIGYCTVPLITTASGCTVLVDTGVHQTREMVLAGLQRLELEPDDVDYVVLTHLHFDHCENVGLFAKSTVVVHEAEIVEAEAHPSRDRYLADFWRELLDRCKPIVMTGPSYNVDDEVTIHHLPGHRHGQLGVSVDTSAGRVVCCSDVAKNAREIIVGEPPVSDPQMLDAARRSIAWLRSTADIVVPGHDRTLSMVDGFPVWTDDQNILVTIY